MSDKTLDWVWMCICLMSLLAGIALASTGNKWGLSFIGAGSSWVFIKIQRCYELLLDIKYGVDKEKL